MLADEVGREILALKPVVSEDVCISTLRALPAGSFGRAYAEFMDSHKFDAKGRPSVSYVDDPELAYVMLRYREARTRTHAHARVGFFVTTSLAYVQPSAHSPILPLTTPGTVLRNHYCH
jgi:ubiquinone biosynthesis protein COQ4